MKQVVNGSFRSIYLESKEIKYVRIDNKNNVVIIFQGPLQEPDGKLILGYRAKLTTDPTAPYPDAEFKIGVVDEERMYVERKIVEEGILTDI